MDDVLVLAPTHRTLRHAVRVLNRVLGSLGLEKHPAKTFIGKIERGFDFLGYHLTPAGLTVARATVARFTARVTRLYEQEHGAAGPALGSYVGRWTAWATGGLAECPLVLSAASAPASHTQPCAA
jgi:RNA-directed DNA polymerase